MARELQINIRTSADLGELDKLAKAFDNLEKSIKSINNIKAGTGIAQGFQKSQAAIKGMLNDVKALDKALKSVNKAMGGSHAGTSAARAQQAAARAAQNALKLQQQQARLDGILQRNAANAAKAQQQAATAQMRNVNNQNAGLRQQQQLMRQIETSNQRMIRLQDRQQGVAGGSNTLLTRMRDTEQQYQRTLQQMQRAWNTTDAGAQSSIQRGLSRSLGEFNAELKQMQGMQNTWTTQIRAVQRYRDELVQVRNEAQRMNTESRQAMTAAQRDRDFEGQNRALRDYNHSLEQIEQTERKIQELDRQSRSGNEYYDRMGREIQRYTQLIDQAGQHQAAYHQRLQQLRQTAADQEAMWNRMSQGIHGFLSTLSRAAQTVANFASQMRSRLNSAFSGISQIIGSVSSSVAGKFASMRASLDSTGKTFLGFGKSAKSGMSQANIALNEFFSAGWSLLASGSIVRGFGQNILGSMYRGLGDYQQFEQQLVRLGVSGSVWGTDAAAPMRAGQPDSLRGLEDLVFGIQSGRTRTVNADGSVSYQMGTGVRQFNATQIADALYYFSSAVGSDLRQFGPQTAEALKPILRVSAFTQADPEMLIKGTLNTMMEFGYDPRAIISNAAAGKGNTDVFNQIAGMVAVASNVSSMEVQDVFEAFKMLGPMVHKLTGATEGAGLEDAMAAIFMASEVGLKGGNVGRGLDRMVTQLLDPDGPMREVIKKYFGDDATIKGLFFNKDGTLQGGLKGVFDTLISSNLNDAQLASMLGELFTQNAARASAGIIDPEKLRAGADVEGSWAWFQEQMNPENIDRFMSTSTAAMENTVTAAVTNMGNAWNMVKTMIVESVRGDLISNFNKLADVIWDIGYALRDNAAIGRFVAYLGVIAGLFTTIVGTGMVLGGTILLVARAFAMLGGTISPVLKVLAVLPGLLASIAPLLLALGLIGGVAFVAWEENLGGFQDRLTKFIDGLTWERVVGGLERVMATIEQIGSAFMEFIRGPLLGLDTGVQNLQSILQRVFGTWLGNLALKGLYDLGAAVRDFFSDMQSGEGNFGRMHSAIEAIGVIARNAGDALRGLGELFFFGTAQGENFKAIQAIGDALGIEQPITKAIQAINGLHGAFETIGGFVDTFIASLQNLKAAFEGLGLNFGDILTAGVGAAITFLTGLVTGFIQTLTTLANVVTSVLTRVRQEFDQIQQSGDKSAGFIDDLITKFSSLGLTVSGTLQTIGSVIGVYLGARLITALIPGFNMFMSLGLAAASFGARLIGVGAQIALFGVKMVANLALIGVQLLANVAAIGLQAAAWAASTVVQGLQTAATVAQEAAQIALIASIFGVTAAETGAIAATMGLTGAFAALDIAALPVTAIIAAIALAVMALPVAFFGAAAAIFVFTSATDGIRAGIASLVTYFTSFWQVASMLEYPFRALAAAVQLAIAPFAMLASALGVHIDLARVLGAAFGAVVLVIGTGLVGTFLMMMAPILAAAAGIMLFIKAIGLLVDAFSWLLGKADDVGEALWGWATQLGDLMDYPIEKVKELANALESLMRYAGLSFVIRADGSGFDVIKAAATTMLGPAGVPLSIGLKAADLAYRGYKAGPSREDIAGFLTSSLEPNKYTSYDDLAYQALLAAQTNAQSAGQNNYDLLVQRGVYTQNDVNWLQSLSYPQSAQMNTYAWGGDENGRPMDMLSRPTDPGGMLTGNQRNQVATYGDAIATAMITAYQSGMGTAEAGLATINQIQKQAEDVVGNDLIPAVADTFAGEGMRNGILGEMRKSDYATETAIQNGVQSYTNQMKAAAEAAWQENLPQTTAGFNAMQDYEAILGASGAGFTPTAAQPTPPKKPKSWKDTAASIVKDVVGEDNYDKVIAAIEAYGFDIETGTFTGKNINQSMAITDPTTSKMMRAIFPNWDAYVASQREYEQMQGYIDQAQHPGEAMVDWAAVGMAGYPAQPSLDQAMAAPSDKAGEEDTSERDNFIKQLRDTVTADMFTVPDIASGLSAVFGRTSAGAAFGSLAEGIMGNIDDEVLKANPWFNQDELMANAAISAQRSGASQSVAGKNLRRIMEPMLQSTADELGVSMDSLLQGIPEYYFDPDLLPTAQTAMFSALTKMTPEQGQILDALGMTPDAQTGQVFEQMGLDWASLTQYAVSNAMEGKDWDLSHYLMDAWDISQEQATAYIKQNGLDPRVINESMFGGVEAAYLSSGGQVQAMTEDMWQWLADATQNGADNIIDITRSEFEKIPESARIVMSNMGFAFNIVDDDSITAEVEKVTDAIDTIKNASLELQELMQTPGVSNINARALGEFGGASGQSVWDIPGTGNVETALNFNAMIHLGIDNNDATKGLIETYNEADNTYTLLNEIDGTTITINAPEYEAFKKGMDDVEQIIKDKYQKYLDASKPGSANDPYGDVFNPSGPGHVEPKTYEDWVKQGAEGLIDENGNLKVPLKTPTETIQALTGFDLEGAATLANTTGVAVAQAFQSGFSNNMSSDTEIKTAITETITNAINGVTEDTSSITEAATRVGTAFQTALSVALSGGGESFAGQGARDSVLGDTGGGSMATIAQQMVTDFQTAFQSGISTITVDVSSIGSQMATSASEWGTTAGAAFAAAFAAASSMGAAPQGPNGSQDPALTGSGLDSAPTMTQTVTIDIDTTLFDAGMINVSTALTSITSAHANPQVWLDGTIFFGGAQNVLNKMTDLDAATAYPTVGIIDNASAALGNIYFLLSQLTDRTVTVTTNVVTAYSTTGSPTATGSPATIPGLASGGVVTWDGLTKVGEEGWELVELPMGSRVFDHDTSEKMVSGTSMLSSSPFNNMKGNTYGATSQGIQVNIYNPTMTSSQSVRELSKQVSREIGKQIEAANKGQAPRTP